jgi:hypothetical protein
MDGLLRCAKQCLITTMITLIHIRMCIDGGLQNGFFQARFNMVPLGDKYW